MKYGGKMSLFKQLLRNLTMGGGHSMRGGHHGKYNYNNSGSSHHGYNNTYNGQATPMQTCPQCRSIQANEAKFCGQCGTALSPANCTRCANVLPAEAKFCGQCGQAR